MRGSAREAMGKEGEGWGWGGRRSEACGKTTTGAAPLGEGKHGTGMDLGWVGVSDALGSSLVCARAPTGVGLGAHGGSAGWARWATN